MDLHPKRNAYNYSPKVMKKRIEGYVVMSALDHDVSMLACWHDEDGVVQLRLKLKQLEPAAPALLTLPGTDSLPR